ncbi:hypothetical protein QR685DRAFT_542511 [Neurospora intermedia]|uniref:Uncharacterized protein n=1 Tax=Neurospora intermedia TaxID=5142 RepID=A0ABR3DMY4_NEUIN
MAHMPVSPHCLCFFFFPFSPSLDKALFHIEDQNIGFPFVTIAVIIPRPRSIASEVATQADLHQSLARGRPNQSNWCTLVGKKSFPNPPCPRNEQPNIEPRFGTSVCLPIDRPPEHPRFPSLGLPRDSVGKPTTNQPEPSSKDQFCTVSLQLVPQIIGRLRANITYTFELNQRGPPTGEPTSLPLFVLRVQTITATSSSETDRRDS